MGVLSNEEQCSKKVTSITYLGQFFQVFIRLWPMILFLFPHLTCSRTLPNSSVHLFAKMDSTIDAYGSLGITDCGVVPPPF